MTYVSLNHFAELASVKVFHTEQPVRHIEVYSGLASLKAITINEYIMVAFPHP